MIVSPLVLYVVSPMVCASRCVKKGPRFSGPFLEGNETVGDGEERDLGCHV